MNVTNERAKPRAIVDILHRDKSRRGNTEDVIPPICSIVIKVAHRRGRRAANARRHRVPRSRGKVANKTADRSVGEAFVA